MVDSATLTLGTSPLIRLPKQVTPTPLEPGQGYFRLRLLSAQAAIFGPFWQQAQQLVVTSEVRLFCPPFNGEPVQSIQRIRPLKQGAAEQLGLSPALVDLMPATLDKLGIAIEFLLDRQNRLATLAKIVNDDAFLSVVSLAPGAAAAARAVGALSKKLVDGLLDEEDQVPVLRFVGDFSLPAGDLADAYYVILGTRYEQHPLPRPLPGPPRLRVEGHDLLLDNQPVVHWSYVILDVDVVEMRTRELGRGELWYEKLDQVEAQATQAANTPWLTDDERRKTWESCLDLLKEADLLLRQSPLYLPAEADTIIQQAYYNAYQKVSTARRGPLPTSSLPLPPLGKDKVVSVENPNELKARVDSYEIASARSRGKLRTLGMLK